MSKRTGKSPYSGDKMTGVKKLRSEKKPFKQKDNSKDFYSKYPRWLFSRCDFDHPKWGMACNSSNLTKVFRYLSDLESQKWGEILTDKSGRGKNTRSHEIDLTNLIKEAQVRAVDINVDEFDALCSISVGSRKRVWGYISDGLFYIIWFDMQHEICPTEKRHT